MEELLELTRQFLSCLEALKERGAAYAIPKNPKVLYVAKDGPYISSVHFNSVEELRQQYTQDHWEPCKFVEVM